MTTSLGKKLTCILPMFRLDALVLRANETRPWMTSIYSYIKACERANALPTMGMHIGCLVYDAVRWTWLPAPPLASCTWRSSSRVCCSLCRNWCELSGAVRMQIASFKTKSMVGLACHSMLVSSQWIGWSSIHVCSSMADLSVTPLMRASLCSFRRIST